MAESSDASANALSEALDLLARAIHCPSCRRVYAEPKVLPCLHAFCRECTEKLLSNRKEAGVECPQCRCSVELSASEIDELPALPCVKNLAEAYEKLRRAVDEKSLVCGLCEDGAKSVESFCRECGHFVCPTCTVVHKKLKPDHREVISMTTELEGAKVGGSAGKQLSKKLPIFACDKHKGKLAKSYCFNCQELICQDCITATSDHASHTINLVEDVATAVRKDLLAKLSPFKRTWADVSSTMGQTKRMKDKVTTQKVTNAETITRSFDQLYTILEGHKKTLIQHANAVSERKISALRVQEEQLQQTQATLKSLVQFIEKETEIASDEALVMLQPQMVTRMEELTDKYQEVKLNPTEIANVAIRVTPRQKLEELCQSHCEIYLSHVDPQRCTFKGQGMVEAMTNQTAQLTVQTFDNRNQHCVSHQRVSAEIKPLTNGGMVYATVVAQKPSKYELSYVPTVRGRHEMTIKVNGIDVKTFPIFVHHHPSLMGRPSFLLRGIDSYRIAINSNSELYVSDFWRDEVAKFDGHYKKVQALEVQKPSGITTDVEGNIYVATTTQRLLKYSSEGVVLRALGKEDKKKKKTNRDAQRPAGICCFGKSLYVCDQSAHRIQVYDLNLKPIRSFGSHGPGDVHGQLEDPQDIAPDVKGNVYIADATRHQVVVFTESGQYVRHLGGKGSGRGELSEPRGICVIGDFAYIAESGNSRISVFQTSGEFVTSFGRPGSSEGEFKNPWGLAANRDGFLFVCDPNNHRIQIL